MAAQIIEIPSIQAVAIVGSSKVDVAVVMQSGQNIAVGVVSADNAAPQVKTFSLSKGKQVLFSGGAGDDVFLNLSSVPAAAQGGDGNDRLIGGVGNDTLKGGAGDDQIVDYFGKNTLYGDDGNDLILAGSGNDTIWGGAGNDVIFGGDGSDRIYGEAGRDLLFGGAGIDLINGGDDNDLIDGGDGLDLVTGGAGNNLICDDLALVVPGTSKDYRSNLHFMVPTASAKSPELLTNPGQVPNRLLLGGNEQEYYDYIRKQSQSNGMSLLMQDPAMSFYGNDQLRSALSSVGMSYDQILPSMKVKPGF